MEATTRAPMRATIITDASWCPNTRAGGWAAWVTLESKERLRHHGPFRTQPQSSNEAELWASLNGIVLAYAAGARSLLVQSDCNHVVLKATASEAYRTMRPLKFPEAEVRFRHVKGHTSHAGARYWVNRWCDRNARRHMRDQRKELEP